MGMHKNELSVDEGDVRLLIAEQFPEWQYEPIRRLVGNGTVNSIFRIGNELSARFRLQPGRPGLVRAEIDAECAAMRELSEHASVPVPLPVATGEPGRGYPLPWSVQTWVNGQTATSNAVADSIAFADDLVTLLAGFRRADTRGRAFSGVGRGGNLHDSDEWMAECFRRSEEILPVQRLRALWATFRELPSAGRLGMTHGDLTPENLLLDGERLSGVIDGGGFGPTDPALDLVSVWHLLAPATRLRVRQKLDVDALEWQRGAAWAFQQAMGLVWYYREPNPTMSELGRSTLARILADHEM